MSQRILVTTGTALVVLALATGCPPNQQLDDMSNRREQAQGADDSGTKRGSGFDDPVVEITEGPGFGSGPDDGGFVTSGAIDPPVDSREIDPSQHLSTVYFEFDRDDLSAESRDTVRRNAEWLRTQGGAWNVVIEGHCDDRGTIEYNLALGERRADSIRDYMESLGVDRGRMRVVSYGEELPAIPGQGEMAWARNRRGEFTAEN